MEPEFWREKWQKGDTGFHEPQGNRLLRRYWSRLGVSAGSRVLVPLCGKTPDLLWLRDQGHHVIGVELSALAVEALFAESDLSYQRRPWRGGWRYGATGIEVLQGDFFALTPDDIAGVAHVYDRAALIALPRPMRERYANHLLKICPGLASMLLVTLQYQPDDQQGPPFSVAEEEVEQLYGDALTIARLAREEVEEIGERMRRRGITALRESVYRLER